MNIGFMGLGKLGLPCALAIESKRHVVKGYDIDPKIAEIIVSKELPYREKGAQELLESTNLEIVEIPELIEFAEMIFVAIQTPHEPEFEGITRLSEERKDFDYSHLCKGVIDLSTEIYRQKKEIIVIIVSTVLPGTIERELKPLLNKYTKLCYNPFFIAMGTCIQNFLYPEFVLFGVDDEEAAKKTEAFYQTINDAPFYETSVKNAELIKVGYNTFIGMKIVFANTLMEICHKIGADVDAVTDGIKLGIERIISGKYFSGGMGDGGGCHPRDNIALSWLAKKLNLSHDFFEDLMKAREDQTEWLACLLLQKAKEHNLPMFILGKAFKPETNLTVGSPSILLVNILGLDESQMYDPYVDDSSVYLKPAIYLIGTKHPEFVNFEFPEGSVVIDPWRYIPNQPGVEVIGVGRG